MKRFILLASLSATNVFASEQISYEEFMKQVNTAQRKIDYSETLIKRSELESLIIKRDGKDQRGRPGKNEGGTAWLPDAFKGDDDNGRNGNTDQPAGNGETDNAGKSLVEDSPAGADSDGDSEGNKSPGKEMGGPETDDKQTAGKTQADDKKVPKPPAKEKQQASKKKALGKKNRVVKTVYLPPALAGFEDDGEIQNKIAIKAPVKSIVFGIPIGTRIPVELKTGASNAQPGYIQLTVLKDIEGDKKVLPKGSTLFARGRSFPGTSRLHATASKGITIEEHEEFSLSGIVFADDGQAGFIGEIVSDGRTLERATDVGLYAIGSGIIAQVPGADLTTSAGKEAAKQVLSENEQESIEENGRVRFIVEAEPQIAVLQIEATF